MEVEIVSSERYYLQKLGRYLNYELSSSVLYFLSYVWVITLILVIIAAAVFIPLMLYVFFKERKTAWFISFLIVVIIPFIICVYIGLKLDNISIFILVPLGFFYFYCFILKWIVNDRLKELTAHEELQRKREKRQKEQSLW